MKIIQSSIFIIIIGKIRIKRNQTKLVRTVHN